MRHVCLALAILVALASTAVAQNQNVGRFRAVLRSGALVEGTRGVLTATALEGVDSDGRRISVPRGDIGALDAWRGTRAGPWGLVGGSIGALISLTAWRDTMATTPMSDSDHKTALTITIAATAGGAVLGALIGSAQKRWETIPVHPALLLRQTASGSVGVVGAVVWRF